MYLKRDPRHNGTNLYYLQGIVSSGKQSVTDDMVKSVFVAFTDITYHLEWMKATRDAVDKEWTGVEKYNVYIIF